MSRVKKSVGRPKKPDGRKRSHAVTVRLTDTEYERVVDGARRSGMSMANYVKIYGDRDYDGVLNSRGFEEMIGK